MQLIEAEFGLVSRYFGKFPVIFITFSKIRDNEIE